jgi:hypothetical protein
MISVVAVALHAMGVVNVAVMDERRTLKINPGKVSHRGLQRTEEDRRGQKRKRED